jgi:hypothetical protein
MTKFTYSRNEDGTLTPHRLHHWNGELVTEDGQPVVVCRDCGEPIWSSNWNGRCLQCHESIVG